MCLAGRVSTLQAPGAPVAAVPGAGCSPQGRLGDSRTAGPGSSPPGTLASPASSAPPQLPGPGHECADHSVSADRLEGRGPLPWALLAPLGLWGLEPERPIKFPLALVALAQGLEHCLPGTGVRALRGHRAAEEAV